MAIPEWGFMTQSGDWKASGRAGRASPTLTPAEDTELGRGWWIAVTGVLVVAAGLRFWRFLASPLLANDEAALAWSFETRGFLGLLRPLEFSQGAPIGFLEVSKAFQAFLGATPAVYRLQPFIVGLLLVLALATLGRRWLGRDGAIGAALLAAVAAPLVNYSVFFKQYSGDVLVTLLLLFSLDQLSSGPPDQRTVRPWIVTAVLVVVMPWFSHPSIFVFSGGVLCVFAALWTTRDRQGLRWLTVISIVAGFSFLAHYLGFTRHLNQSDFLREFWRHQMLPDPFSLGGTAKWLIRTALEWPVATFGYAADPTSIMGLICGVITLMAAALGWVLTWRRARLSACLMVAPLLVVLVAGAVRMYPLGGRLLLFTAPILILLMSAAIVGLVKTTYRRAIVFIALACYIAFGWVKPLPATTPQEDLSLACKDLANRLGKDDHVYIFYPNRVVCFYSLVHASISPSNITTGAGDSNGAFEAVHHVNKELSALPFENWPHAWVVLSHPRTRDGRDEGDVVLDAFRSRCRPSDALSKGEVRLFKFQCARPGALVTTRVD